MTNTELSEFFTEKLKEKLLSDKTNQISDVKVIIDERSEYAGDYMYNSFNEIKIMVKYGNQKKWKHFI